jgi:putative hydrolase of the HAD superfamily
VSSARLDGDPVRAVLFDYGDTLVTHRRPVEALQRAYAEIAEQLAAALHVAVPSAAELLVAVHDRVDAAVAAHQRSGALEEIDIGRAHRAAYHDLGLHPAAELVDQLMRVEQEAWWRGASVGDDAVATLVVLRQAGLRLGLVSNAAYLSPSMRGQLAYLGLTPLLDSATFSGEVGWRKPSRLIFERALSDLGAEPRSTIMVGDSVANDIAGGRAAGMRTVRLRQHVDDPAPVPLANALIDRLLDLPPLLGVPTPP